MSLLERSLRRVALSPIAATATWPHGVDAFGPLVVPAWPVDGVRARIVGLHRQTADTTTVSLRPNGNWLGHRPGQHVVLTVEIDGVRHARCFSVASSAHQASVLELTVKAGPASIVARHLGHRAAIGDLVDLSAAEGEFVLPDSRPGTLALLGAGSGITPLLSMLRTLADEDHHGEVAFVQYARTGADVLHGDEVRALVAGRPGWQQLVVTEHDDTGDLAGRFVPGHLAATGLDIGAGQAFVCGPGPFMAAVDAAWRAGGGPPGSVQTESYGAASPDVSGTATGTIRYTAGVHTATVVDDGRPLLLQAESAGLAPAHGCRRGICRTCVVPLRSGTVVEEGGVRIEAGAAGDAGSGGAAMVRLCVTVADGDVEVTL